MKYTYQAKLVRLVDGDTYVLEVDVGFGIKFIEKFRLFGADTPEVFGKRASVEGHKASAFVQKLFDAQSSTFNIETHKDHKGKYGRYLVDIEICIDQDGIKLDEPISLSDYLIQKKIATPI